MTRDPEQMARGAGRYLRPVCAAVLCSGYVIGFFSRVPRSWNGSLSAQLDSVKQWGVRLIQQGFWHVGMDVLSRQFVSGAYLLVFALVIPWLAMGAMGRGRPFTLGCRLPNRFGRRLLLVGYILAAPFLVWMVRSPQFAGYYLSQLQAGAAGFLVFYAVNMMAEHFLFQGVLLAVLRRSRGWPEPIAIQPIGGRGLVGVLQWLGMAAPSGQARGLRRVRLWLGLADGCVFPILVSGLLFGAAHLGKDPRELLLSIPGGIMLGYIAYRADTWLVPLGLHLATAGTACWFMLLAQPT